MNHQNRFAITIAPPAWSRYFLFWFMVSTGLVLSGADARPVLKLQGSAAALVVDLGGGSIVDFHLLDHGLNPLQWDSWPFRNPGAGDPPPGPRPMGHFICLDRWGSTTPSEEAHGMPKHGEAGIVWWEVTEEPKLKNGIWETSMKAELPMARLKVERVVGLLDGQAVVRVVESVTNTGPIGRIYNFVQHPTIGGEFLNETTVVDSNGDRGFIQDRSLKRPHDYVSQWPWAVNPDISKVDVRFLSGDDQPPVVTYLVEEAYGWVTASSPSHGLLIGYLWKTSEYPWLNIWRNAREGKPYARGLEFGTTGSHRVSRELLAINKIFDQPIYRFIDASETQTFSYMNFLLEIPRDFLGVSAVNFEDDTISVVERGSTRRFAVPVE